MTTTITEKPILFSPEMVQAILEGRKTQTRRIMGFQKKARNSGHDDESYREWLESIEPSRWQEYPDGTYRPTFFDNTDFPFSAVCRYGRKGGLLWVRETWQYSDDLEEPYLYRQKYEEDYLPEYHKQIKWKPSIFMPKEACRIYLEITDIRVERLRPITVGDIQAEGWGGSLEESAMDVLKKAENWLRSIWVKINGEGSWDENPWVWVVEFKVVSTKGKPTDHE